MIIPRIWETAKEYALRVIPKGEKCGACQYRKNSYCEKFLMPIRDGLKNGYCKAAVIHPEDSK